MKTVLIPIMLVAAALGNFINKVSYTEALNQVTLSAVVAAPVQKAQLGKAVNKLAALNRNTRSYTYVFAGNAVCEGQPCSNTRIDVRVISDNISLIRQAQTKADGSFEVAVAIPSHPNGIVSWEINGLSSHMEQGTVEGRQIPMDESRVQLDIPLQLAAAI